MLVYEKGTGENRHLYGTMNNIPSESDNQLVYEDRDGDTITGLTLSDTYVDDGHGGILVKGEEEDTFVGVYIKKQDNSLVNIIPGGDYEPETKVLESLRFKKKPTHKTFTVGTSAVSASTGAVIEATFESGEKEIVANDASTLSWTFGPSGEDTAQEGDDCLIATYTLDDVEASCECSVTITPAENP